MSTKLWSMQCLATIGLFCLGLLAAPIPAPAALLAVEAGPTTTDAHAEQKYDCGFEHEKSCHPTTERM